MLTVAVVAVERNYTSKEGQMGKTKTQVKHSLTAIVAGAVTLVVVLTLAAMAVFGFGFFKRATADFRGETEQRERVHADADYRIATYDHFFDLCAAVQSKEATIGALESELETGPPRDRVSQINANITALRSSRAALINEYNADSEKEDTAANFKASGLPYKLDSDVKETQCVV